MKRVQQLYLGVAGPRPRKVRQYTPWQNIVRAMRDRVSHQQRVSDDRAPAPDPRVRDLIQQTAIAMRRRK